MINVNFKFQDLLWRLGVLILAGVLIIAGVLILRVNKQTNQIFLGHSPKPAVLLKVAQVNDVQPQDLTKPGDGRINILLAGKGGANHPGADLTDALMLVSLDPVNQSLSLLSIPRDLYLTDLRDNQPTRINAVYSRAKQASYQRTTDHLVVNQAGMGALADLISYYFQIDINYYLLADFEGFVEAVDVIGGVEIELDQAIYDPLLGFELTSGKQVLDGRMALNYVRSRHFISGDFARSTNQRTFILALKNKLQDFNLLANAKATSQLLDKIQDNVTTNLTLEESQQIYQLLLEIDNVISLDLVGPDGLLESTTVYPSTGQPQSVVLPKAGFDQFGPVADFVKSHLVDGFLKAEQASIAIYYQDQLADQAQIVADQLQDYGYNVNGHQPLPTSLSGLTSQIISLNPEAKYTQRYLEQYFQFDLTSTPPSGLELADFDFLIILTTKPAL